MASKSLDPRVGAFAIWPLCQDEPSQPVMVPTVLSKRHVDRPLAFAHRGGAALWPENTMVAFRGALELGVDFIETDVHLTRDGIAVTHHDAFVDRTTNGSGPVASHSYAELCQLDAGHRFTPDGFTHPFRGAGASVPRFADLLELEPQVRINVELKASAPKLIREMVRLIRQHAAEHRVVVAAADHRIMTAFRQLNAGRIATSASAREATQFLAAVRTRTDRLLRPRFAALQVPVAVGRVRVVDRAMLEACRRHGVQLHVWTIDEVSEIRRLVELGVDGIMTDRPDRLATALGTHPGN